MYWDRYCIKSGIYKHKNIYFEIKQIDDIFCKLLTISDVLNRLTECYGPFQYTKKGV